MKILINNVFLSIKSDVLSNIMANVEPCLMIVKLLLNQTEQKFLSTLTESLV